MGDDLRQYWTTRRHQLASDDIGIDQRHAEAGKRVGDGRFATTDTAGESNCIRHEEILRE
ncbi:hypothetical protein ETAR_27670 [Edwardsiella tarda]